MTVTPAPARTAGAAVVVGAGLAGARAALALRTHGWPGPVVLVGEEPGLPYERPMLSKGYLAGTRERRHLEVASAQQYADAGVELLTGAPVHALLPEQRAILLADGTRLGYEALVLCTGAAAARPPIPGVDLPGVHTLRTIDDADALRADLAGRSSAVVVGLGLIGSEVAATLTRAGLAVTGVDPLPAPLHRVVPAEVAGAAAALHRGHGVTLRTGTGVSRLHVGVGGRVATVELADGTLLPAEVVVLGLGARPRDELAREAGLACHDGILTDEHGRTSAPRVWAAGDVARQRVPHRGRHERAEHWKHAILQAEAVARSIATGELQPLDVAPWFWTEQFGLRLEAGGWFGPGLTSEIDGDLEELEDADFAVRCCDDSGRLVALAAAGRSRQLRAELRTLPGDLAGFMTQATNPSTPGERR